MSDYITGTPIYRFEPADCSRIESLRDGRLFIADPARFNDPLDFQIDIQDFSYRSGFPDERYKAAASELIRDLELEHAHWLFSENMLKVLKRWCNGDKLVSLDDIVERLKQHISTFGVQCFSSSYEIPLSWSHYASGHQGFCIEYDLRKITLASENPQLAMYDVTYSNKLPQVCVSEILFTPHQAISRLLATKTIDWAYEQEFRLVHFTHKGGKIDMPEGLRIASLTGGLNISADHLEQLYSVGRSLNIPVYRMVRPNRLGAGQLWYRDLVYCPEGKRP